jgi:hypothetical protein
MSASRTDRNEPNNERRNPTTTTRNSSNDSDNKSPRASLGSFALFVKNCALVFDSALKEFFPQQLAMMVFQSQRRREMRAAIERINENVKEFETKTVKEELDEDFLCFEKKTKIVREICEVAVFMFRDERERVQVKMKAMEVLFLSMSFVDKERVIVSGGRNYENNRSRDGSSTGSNTGGKDGAEKMTCGVDVLRNACKAVCFVSKDDSNADLTRMVVKMLLAFSTSEHIVNSGVFEDDEGNVLLERLTLRLAHSAVASEGDIERRVAKTALVQHINNSFKRCADTQFSLSKESSSDSSALTCLKALCKIASRESSNNVPPTTTQTQTQTRTINENVDELDNFFAANALDADEYILASRFLAIDLLRQLCEGPNARAWLAAYKNELKKPLSEALLINAMLNPKSTLQKGGIGGTSASKSTNIITAAAVVQQQQLQQQQLELVGNKSSAGVNTIANFNNNDNNILFGFNNATRFHPMALASSSLARATFAAVVSRARDSWKSEIALMFPTMLLHPLERSKSTHVKAKLASLKTLRQIFDDPSTAADVFVNYDCDPRCSTNCFERCAKAILETLKVEREKERIIVNISSSSMIDIDSIAVRDAATQCLVAIVRSLRVWRARNKELGEDLFHDDFEDENGNEKIALQRSGSVSTSFELIPSRNVVVAAKTDKPMVPKNNSSSRNVANGGKDTNAGVGLLASVPLENHNSTTPTTKQSQTKTFANRKKEKHSVEIAVKMFNKTPTMAALREHAPSNSVVSASDAAKFLRSAPGVDPSAIGHLLGSSDADGVAVIRAYLENFDFANDFIDEALRKFMSTFRIPGEAQQIDRLTECFAKRFIELNPNFGGEKIEKKVDCATIIAFAIIMLNTDAHNPMVDLKMRMTREDFLNMALDTPETRGLDEELIRGIYDRVTREEIILSADKRAIAETSSSNNINTAASSETFANNNIMSDFGIFGAFKKKQKILEMEEKIASEESKALLRETARAFSAVTTSSMSSNAELPHQDGSTEEGCVSVDNNEVFVSESAFHAATEAGLSRPMFEVIGEALCRALSIAFGLANDPGRAAIALECARSAMRLAFETKLYTLRDLFGQFLCNATGVNSSGNSNDDGNAFADEDNDSSRVDFRAMQRAEATKTLLDCVKADSDFMKFGQKFWKSCIDICVSLEIAMLENDASALRGVQRDAKEKIIPDSANVQKNIQQLLGYKNIMAWLRPFIGGLATQTEVSEINPDAKAAIDACFVNSTRLDASELSHLVDALIQRSEHDLVISEKSEILKSPNTRIAMKRLADVARANLNTRSLAAWRNVIWGPSSVHLATTATSCVQVQTLVNRNACKEATECLRVVAEAVLLKRGTMEFDADESNDDADSVEKRKLKSTKVESEEEINSSNADAAREDALLPFYEAVRTIANSSFKNSDLENETAFFEMKTRKAEFVIDALRRLAETSSKKFGKSWHRVVHTLTIIASNATLSEYHGNTSENTDYDGDQDDQLNVLFADSAKIRAFVSFRNILVESMLKGRSRIAGISGDSQKRKNDNNDDDVSHVDGELPDDVLPEVVDVLAKFRDVEKQTKNEKGDSIVISEALLSLKEIITRAERNTKRGRNLWKIATRRLVSATFSIENTRATSARAFDNLFSALDDSFNMSSKTNENEKLFWEDVCEDCVEQIVSFTREDYYGKHAQRKRSKNEGFLEAKAFSLTTFFPRLLSKTSLSDIGHMTVSIAATRAFSKMEITSTSLVHALSCVLECTKRESRLSSSKFWSFVCDLLENVRGAKFFMNERRDEVISKSLVCDFAPAFFTSCNVLECRNRIVGVVSLIHIESIAKKDDVAIDREEEELFYTSTRAILLMKTDCGDDKSIVEICERILRYYFPISADSNNDDINNMSTLSIFNVSARALAILALAVDALTNIIATKSEQQQQQQQIAIRKFAPKLATLVALGKYPLNVSLKKFFAVAITMNV